MICVNCNQKIWDQFFMTFDSSGQGSTYCEICYRKNVMEKHPNMVMPAGTPIINCECGAEKVNSNSHSNWCPKVSAGISYDL